MVTQSYTGPGCELFPPTHRYICSRNATHATNPNPWMIRLIAFQTVVTCKSSIILAPSQRNRPGLNRESRFLPRKHYPYRESDQLPLFRHFGAPDILAKRMYNEINGYVGCRPTYDNTDQLTAYSKYIERLSSCSETSAHPSFCRYLVPMSGKDALPERLTR
jgi:hypothetical protein